MPILETLAGIKYQLHSVHERKTTLGPIHTQSRPPWEGGGASERGGCSEMEDDAAVDMSGGGGR